jgi:hypothetical protein
VVLLVLLVSAGSGPVAGSRALHAEPWLWLVGEGPDGVAAARLVPRSALDAVITCGGVAPLAPTSCSSGPWRFGDITPYFAFPDCGSSLGSPVPLQDCYVGTLVAQITDGVRTRTFACNVIYPSHPVDLSCSGFGTLPTEPFTFRCATDWYLTTLEGGVGEWGCVVIVHPPPA